MRDSTPADVLFAPIFTLLLWQGGSESLHELAAGFGITRPGSKAQRHQFENFCEVVKRMAKAGWIELKDEGFYETQCLIVYSKLFDFYQHHSGAAAIDELVCDAMGVLEFDEDEAPGDTELMSFLVYCKLILGEPSAPHALISKWEEGSKRVFPRDVAGKMAQRLGIHLPQEIWHERMPEELKSGYVAQLALQYNLELRVLPEFWREELRKATGARAKAQRSYTEACESALDESDKPFLKEGSKAKLLEEFRRLFWSGRYQDAYQVGSRVIAANAGLKEAQIRGVDGLDMMLCAIAVSGTVSEGLAQAQSWAENGHLAAPASPELHFLVYMMVDCILGDKPWRMEDRLARLAHPDEEHLRPHSPRVALIVGLGLVWTNTVASLSAQEKKHARNYLESVLEKQEPCPAVSREIAGVIAAIRGKGRDALCLANSIQHKSSWERVLDRLQSAVNPGSSEPARTTEFAEHISWEVDVGYDENYSWLDIQPRIISSARAKRGMSVGLSKLKESYEKIFSEVDREVMLNLKVEQEDSYYSRAISVRLDRPALLSLVGHPHVQNKRGEPLKIEQGIIEIQVQESKDGLSVEVEPKEMATGPAVSWRVPQDRRVVVYHRPAALRAALEIFGKDAVVIPKEGAERLRAILETMAKHCRVVTDGVVMEGQEKRESDASIYVYLRWSGSILWVDPQVLPLGGTDLRCFPGRGDLHLTQVQEQGLCTTTRDLDLETRNLAALLEACPELESLSRIDFEQGEACRIDELDSALTVIMELAQADAQLSWESEKILAAPSRADDSRFRIRVGKAKDWFKMDMSYQADEDQVLGFQELIDARIGDGRFLRISKEEVLALSDSMKRRLDKISSMGELSKGGVKSALTSLPLIDSLVSDFKNLELDQGAADQLKSLRRALAYQPSVPKSLKATLRAYQEEGYRWMCRLAKAQLGACLADDMGLGKTVQTLALLCRRQNQGPALVIAPASVVRNWMDETQRFAPKLKPMDLSELRHDFDTDELGAKSVVVASYGIMTKEIDLLEGVSFSTIVFDEAHALKNWGTRRTQAAARLRADFRLGLTGTPVENHVGEIWSLFQILLPGLLGSKKQFEAKYALPGGGSSPDTRALRTQLQPFLLRRTKSQVLSELPELNESVLKVVPSPSEVAFYRALQKSALEACTKAELSAKSDQRLQVLAEITRLRQAAVDPRLVDDLLGPRGEKIQLLIQKLVDLQKEGHRALVFTQFLGSLALVKDALEQAGIEYFELSGSTPPKQRAKRIAAFQEGERDVFLISLRAGGVGVNLTGADYVFHLDPWWNPAVEDQATARAHRMGQKNPVQVYRLITAGTIEEKITQIHELKRDLAEDLLGNLDKANKLSLAQLRELLAEDSS